MLDSDHVILRAVNKYRGCSSDKSLEIAVTFDGAFHDENMPAFHIELLYRPHLHVESLAPMATRKQIITEARTWEGTPWQHQGRLKGIACDCIGHIVCVPRALGLFAPDFPPDSDARNYPHNPAPQIMLKMLNKYLDRVLNDEPLPGDVLWLKREGIARHVGIYTGNGNMIHAIDEIRGVREHSIDLPIVGVWRYLGLVD